MALAALAVSLKSPRQVPTDGGHDFGRALLRSYLAVGGRVSIQRVLVGQFTETNQRVSKLNGGKKMVNGKRQMSASVKWSEKKWKKSEGWAVDNLRENYSPTIHHVGNLLKAIAPGGNRTPPHFSYFGSVSDLHSTRFQPAAPIDIDP